MQAVDSFFVQLGAYPRPGVEEDAGTQFTCFTSTKVQILTQQWGGGLALRRMQVLNLLALPVQKYKY